ncbi:MAG: ECF transporter S component [Clostridia bacterium]|nr:ECF transporter S component [Clostridia bacterium]
MNKINHTKRLTALGVIVALSVVLVWLIHMPIIPATPFLEYDPADIPIYIATFIYGPLYGFVITVIVSLVQGFTVSLGSGVYGIIMHIISTGVFTLTAGLIYKFSKKGALSFILSLVCGIIVSVGVMIPANLFITPLFMGVPVGAVKELIPTAILPFNLIKQCINATATGIIFKPVVLAVKKFI